MYFRFFGVWVLALGESVDRSLSAGGAEFLPVDNDESGVFLFYVIRGIIYKWNRDNSLVLVWLFEKVTRFGDVNGYKI